MMKIIPKIDEYNQFLKLNEDNYTNYTIVPQNKDSENRPPDVQIEDLRGIDPKTGSVTVSDDFFESNEHVNEEGEQVVNPENQISQQWIDLFTRLTSNTPIKGKTIWAATAGPKNMAETLIEKGVPFNAITINKLRQLFKDDKRFRTTEWVDRMHKIVKNFFIKITYEGDREYIHNENARKELEEFKREVEESGLGGKAIKEWFRQTDPTKSTNFDLQMRGEKSGAERAGSVDIAVKYKENTLNNLLQKEIFRIRNSNGTYKPSPEQSFSIAQQVEDNKVTSNKQLRDNPDVRKLKGLKEKLKRNDLSPEERKIAQTSYDELINKGVEDKDLSGEDFVSANLLLIYGAYIGSESFVDEAFLLNKRNVNLNTQLRGDDGRFTPNVKNMLLKSDDNLVSPKMKVYISRKLGITPQINVVTNQNNQQTATPPVRESKNRSRTIYITEEQAKFLQLYNRLNENTATDITKKELGYKDSKDANIEKNIDKTDYAKRLANKRKTTSAVDATKKDGYKCPKKTLDSFTIKEAKGVDKNYTHFAVDKLDGKIANGWDYKGYDTDELLSDKKHYFLDDLVEIGLNPKDYKIVSTKLLQRKGVNPFDWKSWKTSETNNEQKFENKIVLTKQQIIEEILKKHGKI